MSRKVASIALALAIVVPATALAGFPGFVPNDYEGNVERDSSTQFGFDVHRVNGTRRVRNFDLGSIPFSCRDGSSRRQDVLITDGSLRVRDRHFEGKLQDNTMVGHILKVDGQLQPGGLARGVMRLLTHSDVPESQCYSGLLRWKATK